MISINPSCPACGEQYAPGLDRCACGVVLDAVGVALTDESAFPRLVPWGPPPPERFRLTLEVEAELHFEGRKTRGAEVAGKPLLIGRRDPIRGIYPEIDLRGVPGSEYVSRKQASVVLRDGAIWVTDLRGQGTTAVNDPSNPIPAGQSVELSSGDRLVLADSVVLTVEESDF